MSKIFEKIILNQLVKHFYVNNLLHNNQYGFTKGRSTTDAGVALLKLIYDAWEEGRNAIGIFCDLSKAFDCVDHSTLLRKLYHYGIRNSALNLLQSYLSDRTQCVSVGNVNSHGSSVLMGVPQGSILGPFLFLIYINDLPFFVENICKIVLFADDTSLIFKVDRNIINYDHVNRAMEQVLHWFTVNNLLLNSKKTKCVKFALPNVKKTGTNILIDKEIVDTVESTVFLGVTLDSKLQWGAHITCLAGKLSSAAYAVSKIKQLTNVETARLVYFSYFHSVMSYGILLWGNATDLKTIFILQKRAVRAIYDLGAKVSLRERFKNIGILTVPAQFIYACIMFIRQNLHLYVANSDVHSVNTRNKNKLVLPCYRLKKVHGSYMGLGIRLYNNLPNNVLEMPQNKFKMFIKMSLLKKGYYTINECLIDKSAWL